MDDDVIDVINTFLPTYVHLFLEQRARYFREAPTLWKMDRALGYGGIFGMWGMQYNLLFPAIRFDLHEELFNDGYRYVKELQLHHNDEKRYAAHAFYVNKGHYSRFAEHTLDLMEMVAKQSVKTINIR